ncbi:MAG: hypothetical protein AB8B93_16170 [Pseudomonadales bacterium]
MSWIVITVIVLLAAFGPLLWFRPSARDKRLNAMRARARELDLNVDVQALPTLNPEPTERVSAAGVKRDHSRLLAVYSLILPRRLRHVSDFRVFRVPATDAPAITRAVIEVGSDWVFDPDQSYPPVSGWPQSWEALAPLAAELVADVAAIRLGAREIGVFWAEGAEHDVNTVAQIADVLARMVAAMGHLDEQLGIKEVDDDS